MYFRYYHFKFLKRPNAENLCDSLLDNLKQFDLSKVTLLSMDEASTKKAVLNSFCPGPG